MFQDTIRTRYSKQQNRLYLRHGPIDLFVTIELYEHQKEPDAYRLVSDAFEDVLPTLCDELGLLRTKSGSSGKIPSGPVATRMCAAVEPYSQKYFVTPMIAVAGSVADYLADLIVQSFETKRVIINNGGDIAVRLFGDAEITVGICDDVTTGNTKNHATIHAAHGIGGIATSGWKGRSYSLGIADAVTVLARSAAAADTAATLIANAVNLPGSPKVLREPAANLSPDSDLGNQLVTVEVNKLDEQEIRAALRRGCAAANAMIDHGHIISAYLSLQGLEEIIEDMASKGLPFVHSAPENPNAHTGLLNA